MFVGRLMQLLGAMLQRAFRQQVQHLASAGIDPVDALPAIHKTEHLYPIQLFNLLRITADHLYSLFFTL